MAALAATLLASVSAVRLLFTTTLLVPAFRLPLSRGFQFSHQFTLGTLVIVRRVKPLALLIVRRRFLRRPGRRVRTTRAAVLAGVLPAVLLVTVLAVAVLLVILLVAVLFVAIVFMAVLFVVPLLLIVLTAFGIGGTIGGSRRI